MDVEYYKKYYLKNKERIKERVKKYSKQNKEKIRERRVAKKVVLEDERITSMLSDKKDVLENSDGVLWKDIKGFEGKYQMSERREIRRLPYAVTQTDAKGNVYTRTFSLKILKQGVDDEGYLYACLDKQKIRIHWLFYNTFIGDSSGYIIDHIDRNKLNNDPSNLRLVDFKESNKNRTLPYKPSIRNLNKYYQKKHNGSMSKPFLLHFSENSKRKSYYFATYEEAENKYKELYNERQKRIDVSSKIFTIGS